MTTQVLDIDVRVEAQQRSIDRIQVLFDNATSIRDVVSIEASCPAARPTSRRCRSSSATSPTRPRCRRSRSRSSGPRTRRRAEARHDDAGFFAGLSGGWDGAQDLRWSAWRPSPARCSRGWCSRWCWRSRAGRWCAGSPPGGSPPPDHAVGSRGALPRERPDRRPDRRRQHLAQARRRAAGGGREVRRPDRQARLRRLDRPAPDRLDERAAQARHPADAADRLHDRQELHRLGADHRRDGPALLRQRRRVRARLQRQRLHPLAIRLRESGKTVYGFGLRKTPEALRQRVDRFIFLEELARRRRAREPERRAPTDDRSQGRRTRRIPDLRRLLERAVNGTAHDDGWASLSVGRQPRHPRGAVVPGARTTASPSSSTWCAPRATSRSSSPTAARSGSGCARTASASGPPRRRRPRRHRAEEGAGARARAGGDRAGASPQ